MSKAMAVDSSVLLLPCFITRGALGSPSLLPSNQHTHNAISFCISISLHLYIYNYAIKVLQIPEPLHPVASTNGNTRCRRHSPSFI